jgi:hypothetical protein
MPATTLTIAERYTLREELGGGGMGVVWHAYDELLQRDVAVKEVRFPPGVSVADRERLAERTLREARAVAAIDTAAAVRVFDIVEQDGRPWIVMELVRGRTLTEVLGEHTALPSDEVARIGLSVLEALEVAHRSGVLHRDVKPSNVIMGADGRIALTDFGIATDDAGAADATTSVVVGSPGYLAPERAEGKAATPESDLWSLGATLWTAAEGRPPYAGDTAFAVLAAITANDPPECGRCDGPLAGVIRALMARDPADRPGPEDVRSALEEVCRESRLRAAQGAEPSVSRPETDGRTWPLLVALGLVLLLAAGILTAVLHVNSTGGGAQPDPSAGADRSGDAGLLPAGWHRYAAPSGWSIGIPDGWQVLPAGTGVRFEDPAGGRYVEVASQFPASASAVGAWQAEEQAFASSHTAYQRVAIQPVTVDGARQAADWEFTYEDGGAALHAVDHAVVVGRHGYAVFFQTHTDRWEASQRLRERVLSTFNVHA